MAYVDDLSGIHRGKGCRREIKSKIETQRNNYKEVYKKVFTKTNKSRYAGFKIEWFILCYAL